MVQLGLFDRPAAVTVPYAVASDTSRASAAAIIPYSGRLGAAVLAFIRGQGEYGATDPEIAEGLRMLADTARARRVELRDRGLIADSCRRRMTARGRPAAVWMASTTAANGQDRAQIAIPGPDAAAGVRARTGREALQENPGGLE